MRFKAYAWATYSYNNNEFGTIRFDVLPSLAVDWSYSNFKAEDMFDKKDYRGRSVVVMFSWLLWGITLDFRCGDDARSGSEEEQKTRKDN